MNRTGFRMSIDPADYETVEVFIDLDEEDPTWDEARASALDSLDQWSEGTQTDLVWPPEKTAEIDEVQLDRLLRERGYSVAELFPPERTREVPPELLKRLRRNF